MEMILRRMSGRYGFLYDALADSNGEIFPQLFTAGDDSMRQPNRGELCRVSSSATASSDAMCRLEKCRIQCFALPNPSQLG